MSSTASQPLTEAPLGLSQSIEPLSISPVDAQNDKLYGRSIELGKLQKTFQSHVVSNSPQLVVLSGGSGTGKTALANTLRQKNAIFGMGKHDQWLGKSNNEMHHYPYAAWLAVLDELASQITGEKLRIQQALDDENQVLLLQMVPALSSVLSQPLSRSDNMSSITNADSTNRFVRVVRKFLAAASSQQNPLIILLDDLHWADSCSLCLMETIVMEVPSVFVVTTCREDQVTSESPVCESLRRLEDKGARIVNITLSGLSQKSVRDLIQDTFHFSPENRDSVVSLVWSHTNGNAFFVKEFIQFLQESQLIRRKGQHWEWFKPYDKQFDTIHGDVLHLVQEKLAKLDERTLQVLQVASCLGSEIIPILIECRCGFSVDEPLRKAKDKGLIQVKCNYYRFSHDRIQQAVYAMISDPEIHLKIGRSIWTKLSEKHFDKYVFVILNQLSLGLQFINDQEEKYRVASICLLAGRKAAQSSDFRAASRHLAIGIGLLGDDSHWRSQYQLSLNMYNAAAEVEYAVGNMEGSDAHVESVLLHAKRFPEKLTAYSTRVYSYGSRNRLKDAIDLGLEVLQHLGVKFPSKPKGRHVLFEYSRIKWMLRRKSKEALLRLPFMKHPEKLAAMQLMSLLFLYCYLSRPELLPLIMLRMFHMTLEDGICAPSALGFVGYGTFLCGAFGRYEEAYQIGQLALRIIDMFQTKAFLPRVYVMYYGTIHHWRKPVTECIEPFRISAEVGMETGDVEFAIASRTVLIFYSFYGRKSLSELAEMTKYQLKIMEDLEQTTWVEMVRPILQMMLNYMGESDDPLVLTGTACNQESILRVAKEKKNAAHLTTVHMIRMELGYVFCDFEFAENMGEGCEDVMTTFMAAYEACETLFMQGLIALALANKERVGRRRRMRRARKIIRQMKLWAHSSPHNGFSKLCFLEAEYTTVLGKYDIASAKFLAAIALASHEGNIFEQALAEERMGRCFLQQGDQASARHHLQEAHSAYQIWGALGKVRQLEVEMPFLKPT